MRIGIVGIPFTEIKDRPLDTLVGNRVRTWALFTLLENYGFEPYVYVDPQASVAPDIQQAFGARFIRSQEEFLRRAGNGDFLVTIFVSTKLQALLEWHPWLREIRGARIVGTFCYDNNTQLDRAVVDQMVGIAVNTPLQKLQWDERATGVPSFLITTGQSEQSPMAKASNGDVVFMGEMRSARPLRLLAEIASRLPHRKFLVSGPRFIEQDDHHRVFVDFTALPLEEHARAFSDFVSSLGIPCPPNLVYLHIPHGEEDVVLGSATVGLDFSWKPSHNIENSKVPRYLSYGLAPVVELPAPSYRYIPLFGVGEIVEYGASATAWAEAIERAAATPLETKNQLRQITSNFFSWEMVAFEVASFLYAIGQGFGVTNSMPQLLPHVSASKAPDASPFESPVQPQDLLPPDDPRVQEAAQRALEYFDRAEYDACIHGINQISAMVSTEPPNITALRRKAEAIRKEMGLPYIFPAGIGVAQNVDGVYGLLSEGDLKALRYCAENARGAAVNIGVFEGLSAYYLAKVNPGLDVYGIDAYLGMNAELNHVNLERMERAREVLSRLPNAQLVVGLSAEVAESWSRELDFLFIDGDHSVSGASKDFEYWVPHVKGNGLIAVHDAYSKINQSIYLLRKQTEDHGPDVICKLMAESGEFEFVMVSGCTEVWRKKPKQDCPEPGVSQVRAGVSAASMTADTRKEEALAVLPGELAAGRSLEPFRNRYRGKRAFIIGNGPSLKDLDLTLLKDEFTFGVNSIFYHFDEMGFKPTFYVVEDKLVAEDRAPEINQLSGMVKIYGEYLKYCLADRDDVIWANVHFDYSDYRGFPHFSQDAAEGLWVGGTVSYLCMQLAYFMGFEEVYLVGFDHNYVIPKDAKIEGTVITSTSDDPNHFHPHYFGAGLRWHDPRLDRMEQAYRRALQAYEASGRQIANATAGGKLEVFPRCDYRALFASPREARVLPSASTSPRVPEQPRISVVVCTHRQPESLDKTLASLFHQVLPRAHYEVIVVDNRSQDSTPDVVAKYPAARYVLEENLGLSFARNAGIQAARAGIVAFIDDDAEADPCWLDSLLRVYDRDPDAWAVGGKVLPIWDAERPAWLTEQYHRSLSLLDWGDETRPLHWPERIIGANCSFRKDVFAQIGLFDTCLGRMGKVMLGNEDTEIQQRIHALGYRVMYAPEAVVHHHVPAARMTIEYLEKRSAGTLHSEKILELRANQQHEEAEAYVELLCRTEQVLEATKEKLRPFKDKHVGQRCVIIGNGPSLRNMDLSFLKDEITFGLNRIYLLRDQVDFLPTYYVSINPLVIEQSIAEIRQIPGPKFLSTNGLPYVDDPDEFIFLNSLPHPSFSKDPANGLWEGYTVTYVAMQLAYYMGFSEVILIGVDHHFVTSGAPNQEVVSAGADPNHFHPQYFGSGVRWNLPDLANSEVAYKLASEAYHEGGRRILDATLGGRLNVFPKVDYQRLFAQYREQDRAVPSNYAEVYAKNLRGEALFQAGEREQAMRLFEEILDLMPNYGPTLSNLGVALWEGGDFQQALRSFYLALRANPEDRAAIINLAEALACMDVDPQSLSVLQHYCSAHPDDVEVAQLLQELSR